MNVFYIYEAFIHINRTPQSMMYRNNSNIIRKTQSRRGMAIYPPNSFFLGIALAFTGLPLCSGEGSI